MAAPDPFVGRSKAPVADALAVAWTRLALATSHLGALSTLLQPPAMIDALATVDRVSSSARPRRPEGLRKLPNPTAGEGLSACGCPQVPLQVMGLVHGPLAGPIGDLLDREPEALGLD